MSAAAKDVPVYVSGHCGVERHLVCAGQYAGVNCHCTCHSESGGAHQPTVEYDLGDALLHLVDSVAVLDKAVGGFDGNEVELLDLLGQVRRERQHLAEIESLLERDAARVMTQDVVEWTGGTAERRWGKDRKEWQHDDLARAVTAAIVPPLAVNPATGEVDGDLAALLHTAVEQYAATNRPSWRVTAVKPLGIDPDEFCHAVPGRPSVAVHLSDEVPA